MFTYAEDYHQKYALQRRQEWMQILINGYKSFREFVDSTLAARLNAYMGRYLDRDKLVAMLHEGIASDDHRQPFENFLKLIA